MALRLSELYQFYIILALLHQEYEQDGDEPNRQLLQGFHDLSDLAEDHNWDDSDNLMEARVSNALSELDSTVVPSFSALREALWDAINEASNAEPATSNMVLNPDGTLLEHVVQFLRTPLGANRFPRQYLDTLRRALLDPLELAQFNSATREGLACSECGVRFENGEGVTTAMNGSHDPRLVCSGCQASRFGRCRHEGCTDLVLSSATLCREHLEAQRNESERQGELSPPTTVGTAARASLNTISRLFATEAPLTGRLDPVPSTPPVGRVERSPRR